MGSDSVKPFLEFENKWVILLALTSNSGAFDFQFKEVQNRKLYAEVIEKAKQWGSSEELMFVVGATRAEEIAEVRKIAPDYFFLVPGVGAQGGSLEEVVKYGSNNQCGLLVNSSRGIIYAGNEEDFATAAKKEALKIQSEMALYVQRYEW
jgi:orotidine-5'-phosphate decarboxylase